MKDFCEKKEGKDPREIVRQFIEGLHDAIASYDELETRLLQCEERNRALKAELEASKNDAWSSRVTYENVVELIASNEDAAVRDATRKIFEPLLKKEQVRQFRRDIKMKVKELEAADGIETGIRGIDIKSEKTEINVLSPGNIVGKEIRRVGDYE